MAKASAAAGSPLLYSSPSLSSQVPLFSTSFSSSSSFPSTPPQGHRRPAVALPANDPGWPCSYPPPPPLPPLLLFLPISSHLSSILPLFLTPLFLSSLAPPAGPLAVAAQAAATTPWSASSPLSPSHHISRSYWVKFNNPLSQTH